MPEMPRSKKTPVAGEATGAFTQCSLSAYCFYHATSIKWNCTKSSHAIIQYLIPINVGQYKRSMC